MMRGFSFFMIFLMALVFASCKKEAQDAGYFAGVAAKEYYDLLLKGKYQEFVSGYNRPYRIPQGYEKQLLLNAKMFAEQQRDEHKGMSKVNILNAKTDTAHHVSDVFLQIVYDDSTKEQIVVPMIEVRGEWKMR